MLSNETKAMISEILGSHEAIICPIANDFDIYDDLVVRELLKQHPSIEPLKSLRIDSNLIMSPSVSTQIPTVFFLISEIGLIIHWVLLVFGFSS